MNKQILPAPPSIAGPMQAPPRARPAEVKAAEIIAAAIDRLADAIREPRDAYWEDLKSWLKEQEPGRIFATIVLAKIEELESEHG